MHSDEKTKTASAVFVFSALFFDEILSLSHIVCYTVCAALAAKGVSV